MWRTYLISSAGYPITRADREQVLRGVREVHKYLTARTRRCLKWNGELYVHESTQPTELAHGDEFRFTHYCSRILGFDPWEEGIASLYIWRGGGGWAGGATSLHSDGRYHLGWALLGDWWRERGCYQEDRRPGWVPTTEPACFGAWAHEVGHTMNIGPHVKDPDNLMSAGYLGFPDCELSKDQARRLRATGLFVPRGQWLKWYRRQHD